MVIRSIICLSIFCLVFVSTWAQALSFRHNAGQWDDHIQYKANLPSGALFLENDRLTVNLFSWEDLIIARGENHRNHSYRPKIDHKIQCHSYQIEFVGANVPSIDGQSPESTYYNYYLGDSDNWRSKVNAYSRVVYKNIYDNIDLIVKDAPGGFKYEFIVHPEANPNQIQMRFVGVDHLWLRDNALWYRTSIGDIREDAPLSWVETGEKVSCSFLLENDVVRFDLPDGYDTDMMLTIDPNVIFSTYSGSTADNFGYTATYDSEGNAYAGGTAFNIGYPTTVGAYQTTFAGGTGTGTIIGSDIAITKYNDLGNTRLYSTYLGGLSDELPHSFIVNSNNELFVLGTTSSPNFPTTPGAYDESFNSGPNTGVLTGLGVHYENGSDIIVSRFSDDGTALIASTFLGGTGNDGLNLSASLKYNYADEVRGEILIDNNDNIYIASNTSSTDFPVTAGSFQTINGGGSDAIVTKMDNNLTTAIWSGYLGGSGDDAAYSVALRKNGTVYVGGGTQSTDFPATPGTISNAFGGGAADGFIAQINSNGQNIENATYYGHGEYDQIYFVEVGKDENVYLLGQTEESTNVFISNAAYNVVGGGQLVSKLTNNLANVIWSTTLGNAGTRPDISPTAFLVDVCSKVYISGWGGAVNGFGGTTGLDITPDALQSTTDNSDFYLLVIEDDASNISYGTYFGGSTSAEHVDGGTSRFDRNGIIYQSVCAGCGSNDDFPIYPHPDSVVSATNNSNNCNNGIFKFDFNLPIVLADFEAPPPGCIPYTVDFQSQGTNSGAATFTWYFGDGNSSTAENPTYTYQDAGIYDITLVVVDPSACNSRDTIRKQIVVLSNSSDQLEDIVICESTSAQIGLPPINDPTITFQWSPSATLSQDNIPNPIATPSENTVYTLLISNGTCTDTLYQSVSFFEANVFLTGDSILCPNDTIELRVVNLNPSDPLTYEWSPDEYIISGNNTANPLVIPPDTTTFYITAMNDAGCTFYDSITINTLLTAPSVVASAVPDTFERGDVIQLNSEHSTGVESLQWLPAGEVSNSMIPDPTASPNETSIFRVLVTDSNGCTASDTVIVYLKTVPCGKEDLFIPNAFTPNNDGNNDVFRVRGRNLLELYFAVYDRWGQRLFETTDVNEGWDGTFGGQLMEPSVYAYYLEASCTGEEKVEVKGNVTLIR